LGRRIVAALAQGAFGVFNMRVCANSSCVAFGHIVYSLATRCPLCKWDLRATASAKPAQSIPQQTNQSSSPAR